MKFSKHVTLLGLFFVCALILGCENSNQQETNQEQSDLAASQKPKAVYSLCAPIKGLAKQLEDPSEAPFFENLGDYHYPITTSSEVAQRYYDQGIKLANAFNHGEAARSLNALAIMTRVSN